VANRATKKGAARGLPPGFRHGVEKVEPSLVARIKVLQFVSNFDTLFKSIMPLREGQRFGENTPKQMDRWLSPIHSSLQLPLSRGHRIVTETKPRSNSRSAKSLVLGSDKRQSFGLSVLPSAFPNAAEIPHSIDHIPYR